MNRQEIKRSLQIKISLDRLFCVRDRHITDRILVDLIDNDIIELQQEYKSIVGRFYQPRAPHLYFD